MDRHAVLFHEEAFGRGFTGDRLFRRELRSRQPPQVRAHALLQVDASRSERDQAARELVSALSRLVFEHVQHREVPVAVDGHAGQPVPFAVHQPIAVRLRSERRSQDGGVGERGFERRGVTERALTAHPAERGGQLRTEALSARQREVARVEQQARSALAAVEVVARDRRARARELHAQLVRAPGLRP